MLSDTGQTRDGLAVLVPHTDAAQFDAVLARGYARRIARLYAMAQRFARPGVPPRPAYLALTDNQGGFPRNGFFLDGPQRDVPYIDLHRRSTPAGRFGAVDQIFPHEMLHVIVATLAGEMPETRATQVHAIGVRTDRVTAFNEGFAEHGQVMAVDDADAPPETKALAADRVTERLAFDSFEAYRRAIAAPWSIAQKARMTFPVWFSQGEQVLRYHAVRANLFARAEPVPPFLLTRRDVYRAYLFENVLPGRPWDPPKTAARMAVTEGVVSTLFWRIVTDPSIQANRPPAELLARFGTDADAVDGLDTAYLKVFAAIQQGGYDALAVVRAHRALFPADAAPLDTILKQVLLSQPLPPQQPEELWLLNESFEAGTTLFDQFRGARMVQAFDLNAASFADLAAVPGVVYNLNVAIQKAAPFARIEDLERVPGMTPEVFARFKQMREAMLRPPPAGTEKEGSLSIRAILMPYAYRAGLVWLACAVVAAALYRMARSAKWRRLALNGAVASLAGLLAGWTIDGGNGVLAFVTPIVLFGVPGTLIALRRTRSRREAGKVLLAWASAAVAAALAVMPLE